MFKIVKKKKFTLDFKIWCKGAYKRNECYCAIGQYYMACGDFPDGRFANMLHENNLEEDVVIANDNGHISRKDRIKKIVAAFKKYGIQCDVKNADHGLPGRAKPHDIS